MYHIDRSGIAATIVDLLHLPILLLAEFRFNKTEILIRI